MWAKRMGLSCLIWAAVLSVACAQDVPRYGVFEHTIDHVFGGGNPWEDVNVAVTLTSPTGRVFHIGGFHYDTDTWMFRFAPNEEGSWDWSYSIDGGSAVEGSFNCVASASPGFVRQNPDNVYRWVFDNGEPYTIFGAQDCINQSGPGWSNNTVGGNDWRVGEHENIDEDTYLDLLADCGCNLWRLNNANCSPSLFASLGTTGNTYDVEVGKDFDTLARKLRARGLRLFFVLFGFSIPFGDESGDPDKMDALKRFVSYIVNRYGAWVDLWEVANEVRSSSYDDETIRIIAEHVKAIVPYPPTAVSMSWERPGLSSLEIIGPHRYSAPDETAFDTFMLGSIDNWRPRQKPILWGELGNSGHANDPLGGFRWRVATWSLFFNESAPIFWHQGWPDYMSGAANLHFRAEVRDYFRHLADWRQGFDTKAWRTSLPVSTGEVRAYGLWGPENYAVYLYDYSRPYDQRSGVTMSVTPVDGTGVWTDPSTGTEIDTVVLRADGSGILAVPDFVSDIVFKATISPEICDDGLDNDGDGDVDCEDTDCIGDPACLEAGNCADGVDNDGDGDTDCADTDCIGDPACPEADHCADGIDNDDDGDTDCADSECAGGPECPGMSINRAPVITPSGLSPPLADQYQPACRLGSWTLCPEEWVTETGSQLRLVGEALPPPSPSLWLYQHTTATSLRIAKDLEDLAFSW